MNSLLGKEEIIQAEGLVYNARFDEALELISIIEERYNADSIEWLKAIILKGRIFCYLGKYKEAIEIGNISSKLSKKLDIDDHYIDALTIEAHKVYMSKVDESLALITLAETTFESFRKDLYSDYSRKQAALLLLKSEICRSKGELNEAFELAEKCLSIQLCLKKNLDLADIYYHLGLLYLYQSDSNSGLEYATKSLKIQEELNNRSGISKSLSLIGTSYFVKGEFEKALEFARKSLNIKEISIRSKLEVLDLFASVYKNRGQLERAIKYLKRAIKIATEENYIDQLIISTYGIGTIYRAKGDLNLALEYFNKSLEISEEYNSAYGIQASFFHLILVHLDMNNIEKAKDILNQLEKLSVQTESTVFKNLFIISKALVLKNSRRIRNLTEAEDLLKKITEKEIETPILYQLALINLCELYLDELKFMNNVEVLDEIRPLIKKIYEIAERENAYSWLAETKLLQAKLALIEMDIDGAKQLLTQAQRIAELQGLTLLALKISSEHDNLLNQLSEWNNLKKIDAPMSERIELASFNGVVERLQGKRIIDPPLITPEIPVLLLIIGQGGFPLFSNQFEKEYKIEEDLLSGFLEAINSFSGELLSKQLDRVKFEDYMILMQNIENFSVCYLFKGQTYIAKQKLTQFTESIKKDSIIWHTLNVYYNTSRVVKLEDLPSLKALITNIFIK